jgi:hypothetical protein
MFMPDCRSVCPMPTSASASSGKPPPKGKNRPDEEVAGIVSEGTILVYESEYAGTNEATAASFEASTAAFDAEVAALREKGVPFQTFEMDGVEWNEGVASMGDSLKAVWFSDPDGNILNVSTGEM